MKNFRNIISLMLCCFSLQSFAQKQEVLVSKHLPKTDTMLVFLPKNYIATQKYPLVLMLHGWSANFLQWAQITDLQKYADQYGFVIVCPDGLYDSWYLDSPVQKNLQYQSFLKEDLLPFLEKKYSLDRNNYFITGLSMGGHGALNIFLNNLAIFRSAGSSSGVVDLRNFHKRFGLTNILGEYDEKTYYENSVVHLVKNLENSQKSFIFDCGTEDIFYKYNVALSRFCVEKNIKARFISQTGKHDKAYWGAAIGEHFAFFAQQVK